MYTHIDENTNLISNYWKNKNILLTGGTAGLGKALVVTLVSLGAHVAVVARDINKIGQLKQEYNEVITIQADVSNKDDIYKISGQAIGALGQIDVLINNASTLGVVPLQLLADTPCENFSQTLETNVLGPFRLIKAILPSMLFGDKKMVINITSDASISTYPTWGIYSVSKAALDHLTEIWAKELPSITFLSIDPGDMYTQMQLDANPSADKNTLYDPELVAKEFLFFIAFSNGSYSKIRYSASEWREVLV